jgi:hypothetical protein
VSGRLENYHTSNLWSLDLYSPPANHAVQSFVGSGPFDVDLSLFELGDWDQMENGLFSLRPVPSGAFLAIYYLDLVESTAEITLTEATMHVTGSGASFVADGDGDGDVDGADFLHWQRGDPAMITKWHATFGAGAVGSAANVPEPTTGMLIAMAAMGRAALRRRSVGR